MFERLKVYVEFGLLLLLGACKPVVTPTVDADASLVVEAGVAEASTADESVTMPPLCVKVCTNLARLHCPEAVTPDGGKPCVEVCQHSEAIGLTLKPSCVAAAKTLDELRACGTVRCKF